MGATGKQSPRPRDVAIVGGGVIGLCVAESLTARGADVVLLEGGRCGGAASAGNAGWITPALSAPVPAPGTVGRALRWMLSGRGPLRMHLVPRFSFARWIYDFWRSCTPGRYADGIVATLCLTLRALADFDSLAERLPRFEMHRRGVLFVARSAKALAAERETIQQLQEAGYPGAVEVLDVGQSLAVEPALAEDIAGAILTRDERHLRPESLTAVLAAHLLEQGVDLCEQESVCSIARRRGLWTIRSSEKEVTSRRVVLAAGAATAGLLAPLGVQLPLQAAKGYSLTLTDPTLELRHPIYLLDSKVAISPFDGALRLTGILELGTSALGVSSRRVAGLMKVGPRSFDAWPETGEWTTWAGLRPMAPDGLPVLGPVPGHDGLHLATAHSMLGVTLAPTTGAMLAPVILDSHPSPELAPFSINRFNRRVRGNGRHPMEEEL